MHIVYIIDKPNTGGVQRIIQQSASSDALKNYRHTVICLHSLDGDMVNDLQLMGIRVLLCPLYLMHGKRLRPALLWRPLRRIYPICRTLFLARLISKLKADIVHSHCRFALFSQLLACYIANVPLVWTIQSILELRGFDRVMCEKLLGYRRITKRLTVTAISMASRASVGSLLRGIDCLVHIVPNGVNLEEIEKAKISRTQGRASLGVHSDTHLIIGSVGRLRPIKGYDVLIEAIALCVSEMPEASFVIVGDGDQKSALEERISTLGIKNSVRLMGLHKNIPEILNCFDIYVQPSRSEGQCIAVVEAMAAGLPIIATCAGGLSEVLMHGDAGVLVPIKDPSALAGAICRVSRDSGLRSRLASASKSRAKDFSIDVMAERYLSLYRYAAPQASVTTPRI